MVVYIEYVFIENFLLDFTLLFVSLKAARQKISLLRLLFSSALGGVFAVVFPMLSLNNGGRYALKWFTGFLLCFFAFGRVKTKKEWGRYLTNCFFFFFSTFVFGGALTALNAKNQVIWLDFILLSAFFLILVRILYQKRAVARFLYDCKITISGNSCIVQGFYDTGNLAKYNHIPVCLLSPEIAFELLKEQEDFENLFTEKINLSTINGEKQTHVLFGEIEIQNEKRQVYFAVSSNMVKRDYQLILHSEIFG